MLCKMSFSDFVLFPLALALSPCLEGQQAAVSCSPLSAERDWHPYRSTRLGANTETWEPTWAPVPVGFQPAVLKGDFKLTVIATVSGSSDTVASGLLSLWLTPDSLASIQPAAVIGSTDLDFARFGRLNTAYSPASKDIEQPGVQLNYDGQRASFTVGAASSTRRRWRDAGIAFYVEEINRNGFRGRWREGTSSTRPAQGYFCASRLRQS